MEEKQNKWFMLQNGRQECEYKCFEIVFTREGGKKNLIIASDERYRILPMNPVAPPPVTSEFEKSIRYFDTLKSAPSYLH